MMRERERERGFYCCSCCCSCYSCSKWCAFQCPLSTRMTLASKSRGVAHRTAARGQPEQKENISILDPILEMIILNNIKIFNFHSLS